MTVLEAADAMERVHGTRLVIRNQDRFLGLLTEDDIVRKVLAAGLRPDIVRVADVMQAGWQKSDGTLLFEDDAVQPDDLESILTSQTLDQGKCEECGDLCVNLLELDGLLICPDCVEAARLPAY